MRPLLSLDLHHDQDVVTARQRAAQIAGLLEFDVSDQTRIATAVSEIVRNAFRYAHDGRIAFEIDDESRPQRLLIRVEDRGPGIDRIDDVLSGRDKSTTAMGRGIVGARRLMDRFELTTSPAGTTVVLEKFLPARTARVTGERAARITETVRQRRPQSLIEEVQAQNQQLLRALDELQRKQQELTHLNHELEDTNRGVVALYAELDEKADHLRRADQLKSRFLSNMTHEFRTPVNSIVGLCNLLVDDRQRDGQPVEPEIVYIRKAADQLSDLVNDLLDLAKVEAGKSIVRPAEFEVRKMFGALRGMLRPLRLNQSVGLVFEDGAGLPPLYTDEGKLSQILRNLVSNALKFTERGEVRIAATADRGAGTITFSVADTGIGIAPDDQARVFEEFAQLEHRLQRGVRGTGLGLPLSRRLSELLGGTLSMQSEAGRGSTFSVTLPIRYEPPGTTLPPFEWVPEPGRLPLLVVEDACDAQFLYQKLLKSSAFQVYPAASVRQAEAALAEIDPAAIVLDVVLGGEEAWEFLAHLKRDQRTRAIPVVIVSSLAQRDKGLALGADAYLMKPIERRVFVDTLTGLLARQRPPIRVLTIDDEEISRFLIRQCLPIPAFEVSEAESSEEGVRRARAESPDVIVLDLVMPGENGRETLRRLRADPGTRAIPVVIATTAPLEDRDTHTLLEDAVAVMSKADLSRESLPRVVLTALGRAV